MISRLSGKVDIMKEEFLLEQKYGKRRPFNVPEGYFEHVEGVFMQNIQEHERKRAIRRRLFVRYAACAACVVMLVVSGFVLFLSNADEGSGGPHEMATNYSSSSVSDYMMDELSDYAMLDNDDFYSYVSEE